MKLSSFSTFSLFNILPIFVMVFAFGVIIFTFVAIFSPKVRAKMMRKQVESAKMMFDETKDVLKDLSASTVELKKDILNENIDDLRDIESMNMDIKEDSIRRTVQAVKEGWNTEEIRCRYCGEWIDNDSKFCKHCGREQ